MNRNLNQRWQKKYKRLKNKLPHLSNGQWSKIESIVYQKDQLLPATVGINENIEEPVDRKLILKFDYFCEEECNWNKLDLTKINALFRILKRISSTTVRELPNSGIIRKDLKEESKYKSYESLLSKVPPDASLKEIELPDGGRVFCFISEENVFIVSIETIHRHVD